MKAILKQDSLQPFLSVLIILVTLFLSAFFKITVRRLSYSLYQENRKFDRAQEDYYANLQKYAHMTNLSRVQNLAKKRLLNEKQKGQIIQVIDGQAFVVQ